VPGLTLHIEQPGSPSSLALQQGFFADIASRYPGWHPGSSQPVEPSELEVWLVAYQDEQPVGCGGLQRLDAETAEIRRIYLAEEARGQGLGRRLLDALEQHARDRGYIRVRLTTGDAQPEALGLFRSAGYEEIAPFTDGAFTRHWMEKRI
jgi:GNAT superfamily N-acetyltransferase